MKARIRIFVFLKLVHLKFEGLFLFVCFCLIKIKAIYQYSQDKNIMKCKRFYINYLV